MLIPAPVSGVSSAVTVIPAAGAVALGDLGRLVVFGALVFVHHPIEIVALAVLAGIGNGFFRPAVLAGLPNLRLIVYGPQQ